MANLIEEVQVQCPYCFEDIWMDVDTSGGKNQDFVEDCEICCHPIRYRSSMDEDGQVHLMAARENG